MLFLSILMPTYSLQGNIKSRHKCLDMCRYLALNHYIFLTFLLLFQDYISLKRDSNYSCLILLCYWDFARVFVRTKNLILKIILMNDRCLLMMIETLNIKMDYQKQIQFQILMPLWICQIV